MHDLGVQTEFRNCRGDREFIPNNSITVSLLVSRLLLYFVRYTINQGRTISEAMTQFRIANSCVENIFDTRLPRMTSTPLPRTAAIMCSLRIEGLRFGFDRVMIS